MKRASAGKTARAAQPAPPTPTAEAARVRQGSGVATDPAVLGNLAADPSATVRAALALNPGAPPQANARLAQDPDERVRALLAHKLATLVPCLAAPGQAVLLQSTWDLLATLVEDTAVRVRATIAEVLKDMPQAPAESLKMYLRLSTE